MFKTARIKLTLWYVTIIMAVSLFFSSLVYFISLRELNRHFRQLEMRTRHQSLQMMTPFNEEAIQDELAEARKRLIIFLANINGLILFISSVSGYFLAGKTLEPIAKSLDEQKMFIASASHELKTPLTVIKTNLEVGLNNQRLNKEAKEILMDNLEEIDRLNRLINKLLSLSSLSIKSQLKLENIKLKILIADVYHQLQPLIKQKQIKTKLELKNVTALVDYQKIKTLITILVDNAIKYTPRHGRIIIRLASTKNQALITIENTGEGFSKKEYKNIFKPFYKVNKSRSKAKDNGFGLGLAIANHIVTAHKGYIKVSSQLGKETSFIIQLPLNPATPTNTIK